MTEAVFRGFHSSLALAALCIACPISIQGQSQAWKNADIPAAAEITALTTLRPTLQFPSVLLAGTAQGRIFRSTDSGKNWIKTMEGAGAPVVVFHPFRGSLFAGAGYNGSTDLWDCFNANCLDPASAGGTFRSVDGGLTWTVLQKEYGALAMASRADSLYAATGRYMQVTVDTGKTWKRMSTVSATPSPFEKGVLGLESNTGEFLLLTRRGLYASSHDAGWTWTGIGPGVTALLSVPPFQLIASTFGSTTPLGSPFSTPGLKYTQGGNRWDSLSARPFLHCTINRDTLFGYSDSVVWTSPNRGASWKALIPPLSGLANARAKTPVGDGLMVGGHDAHGLHFLSTKGDAWETRSRGIRDWIPSSLAVESGSLIVADGKAGLRFKASGAASGWEPALPGNPPGFLPEKVWGNNGKVFAVQGRAMMGSDQGGKPGTWVRLDSVNAAGFTALRTGFGLFQNTTYRFMACDDRFFPPVCNTAAMKGFPPHRTQLDQVVGALREINPYRAIASSGDTVVIALADSVFRSFDRGETWSGLGNPPAAPRLLAYRRGILILIPFPAAPSAAGTLYRWDEASKAWAAFPSGNLRGTPVAIAVREDAEAYLATDDGIFRMGPWDADWTDIGRGLPVRSLHALSVNGDLLAASLQDGSVWTLDLEKGAGLERSRNAFGTQRPGLSRPGLFHDGAGWRRTDGRTLPR